jgi:trimeric autotransporter adhesin
MKAYRAHSIFLCLSLLTACGSGALAPGVGGILRSIQVAPSTPSVPLGLNQQFTAIGHYQDGSSADITASVAWASSNTTVATISGSGFAISRATGSASISATLSGVSGFGTVVVTQAVLASISITPTNPDMLPGTLQQFTATGIFSDQSSQDITASVTWSSSNSTVASISGGGLATAVAIGSLMVSAASNSISASTTVNVQPAVLSSMEIQPANGKIAQLTSQQFQAIGTYTDGTTHNVTGKVSWTSSNTTVASIAGNGLASAVAPGSASITATLDSISASTTLEVTDATLISISIKPPGRTIAPGTKLSFSAIGLFSDNTTQVITRDCTWTSDNQAVVTIGLRGTATAVGPGTANISATLNGVTNSVPLSVGSATLISISVTPVTAVLAPTTFVNCVATGTFSDGSTQVITNIAKWTSSASTVASIGNGNKVTANSGGTAIITAQFGSVRGDSTITVDSSPITSIQISPPTASIRQQTGVNFRAIGTFADGKTQDLTQFALWTSSMPSVATINAGRANGLATGTATIVAVFADNAGIADLNVTSATATSLGILPDLINFSGVTTEDVTSWIPCEPSTTNVATMTPAGRATSTGAGTAAVKGAWMVSSNSRPELSLTVLHKHKCKLSRARI